jgi:ABC-2 type transport system ATP-binding protein
LALVLIGDNEIAAPPADLAETARRLPRVRVLSSDKDPILVVEGLAKSYGAVKALDGVDLTIRPGEFVVLLGRNGAGKTTLLQLLTGLFSADRGRISIFGSELRTNPTGALARLGVIFQQPTLDLELTVRANLLYHTDLHGIPRRAAHARIDAELERLGLPEAKGKPARTLSGGNRRRVELVRAMLHKPSLLLMDEATVGLDPASRRALLEHILSLKSDGIGVLWTTHLIDEAEQADRVVVLHRGLVLFDGRPAALISREHSADLADAFLAITGSSAQPEISAS